MWARKERQEHKERLDFKSSLDCICFGLIRGRPLAPLVEPKRVGWNYDGQSANLAPAARSPRSIQRTEVQG